MCLCEALEVYRVVIHVMLPQIPKGKPGGERVRWKQPCSERPESVCEAEAASGRPRLTKQGNIPCNHSIYSRMLAKGGLEGRKSCKI